MRSNLFVVGDHLKAQALGDDAGAALGAGSPLWKPSVLELNQPSSVVEAVLEEEAALLFLQELLQELNQPSVDAAPPVYCEAALWEEALSRALSRALRGVGPWEAAVYCEAALWEDALSRA